jgi:hypothetical protein
MGGLWSRRPIKNLSSHQKKFFSDLVKFHYGLPSEAIARKKSILALSFEIFAPKKFFYGHSQISLWAVYGVKDQ